MSDTSKIPSGSAERANDGSLSLASGAAVALRMWKDETPGEPKPSTARPYETVGYVVSGRAELHLDGNVVTLEAGDSWVVPAGTTHTYAILSPFTAIEATSPPAPAA